jgi:hypothetical protein
MNDEENRLREQIADKERQIERLLFDSHTKAQCRLHLKALRNELEQRRASRALWKPGR